MRVRSIELSQCGPLRSINADACLTDDLNGFYAVADGVGSTDASARASAFAVQAAHRLFLAGQRAQPGRQIDLSRMMSDVFDAFHEAFVPEGRIPATTLTIAYVTAQGVHFANLGDSPLFRLDGDGVTLLTREHTLVDRGRVFSNFSEMKSQPGSQYPAHLLNLYRPRPVSYPVVAWGGPCRLLICSDGLMELFEQTELSQVASRDFSLEAFKAEALARAAIQHPPDNFTAVLIDVEPAETPHG
jgi:serine/threonine protein phosphatase PrpC